MIIGIFTLLLGLNFGYAQNRIGFATGADFTASQIEGRVSVNCSGFNSAGHAEYLCRSIVLEPVVYDFFLGPRDARAKKISLFVQHQDGSDRERTTDYDGLNGKSRDAFNLWISTLFQRPMLELGTNTVTYTLSDGKNEVVRGTIGVKVNQGARRTCPSATYDSIDINDCNSQYSVCQRYFEEFRNCK